MFFFLLPYFILCLIKILCIYWPLLNVHEQEIRAETERKYNYVSYIIISEKHTKLLPQSASPLQCSWLTLTNHPRIINHSVIKTYTVAGYK